MGEDTDIQLVERGRAGDRIALEQLVVRYQGPIFNAAYRIVGNPDDAADLTQAAFLKAFEGLASFDPKYRFFSWLYRITVNESLNFLRGAAKWSGGELGDVPADGADPAGQAAQSELDGHVQAAMMKLKPEDRVILTMKHFSDCSYRDIAAILELPEKTVKSRLYTARQRLRELLDSWYHDR